ncbi:MAG: UDP-3-O-(3-hydroxymyristoyl)glucosamine N-acyltransferase [Myxococcota bacterium]|jgi:UDP-3-O-[3-hydroxymyristoyl] glucosamine N-acyltransferase|nr:UDP-3-O-(3-hydroxymyristoyl)glucosamine N-acyltransferase [Myxococcota bacterium]
MPTVATLAKHLKASVYGDAEKEIDGIAGLESAGPSHLSFLANPKYQHMLAQSAAGAVLVAKHHSDIACTQVVCDDPYLALANVAALIYPQRQIEAGIEEGALVHPAAEVHPSATVRFGAIVDAKAHVGAHSVIEAGAYIGPDASVGENCLLHPGAQVLERCELGDRIILHAGVVIGSDGFGYAPNASGQREKIPQIGIVRIEDDVEIGANSTIDRATFGETIIGKGTKIDNLVQVAHNVQTGEDCVLVSQSGVAGSATLGDRVIFGAQAGAAGHIHVTNDTVLAARAGATKSVKEPGIYSGTPLMPHRDWLKMTMSQQHVRELRTRVNALEKRLLELEGKD